jgi:hypothetical protein
MNTVARWRWSGGIVFNRSIARSKSRSIVVRVVLK